MKKKVVILGAGYAGIHAGKMLHKKFKKDDSVEITLIDRKPYHTLMTELHEVAGHRTNEDAIRVDIKKIFAKRKVDFVQADISNIDFDKQCLESGNGEKYDYDYLVIGAGSEPCYYGIDGVQENSLTLWSYEDAIKIRQHILNMFRQAEKETNEKKRRDMLTFVVAGAGFTGVEMVGELAEWTKKLCKDYRVSESEVSVYIVDALPKILPMLPENLIAKSTRRLEKMGINIILNSPIGKVDKTFAQVGDKKIDTYTVIWTAGVMGCSFSNKLGLTMGKKGRVQVNEYMQSVDYDNVYLIGDNAYFEENERPVPQIVEAAHQTADTAVNNIHADITGKEKEKFQSNIRGFMVSIGSRYAVANLGAKKPVAMSGFIAMLMKHLINMMYLFKVAGVNRTFSYMLHEFFHVKDRRSFVGGHFSKSSPNFFLIPFRIYLGVMWIIEGIHKIDEGWLKEAKMFASDAVSGASAVVESVATKANEVADAVSSASTATEVAKEAVTTASSVATEQVSQYGEPLIKEVPGFMQWIIDNIVAPNAVAFQTVMVVTEIILGVCLIAGLFTFIWSIISVGMTVGITLTGMADATILWYFFGGIALIGGSGSTLGLDYYVLPWLKKKWQNIGIVKKSYLYFD